MAQEISDELVETLACPRCRGRVKLSPNGAGLVCGACRLLYEIRDGIPVMLVEEARNMDDPAEKTSKSDPAQKARNARRKIFQE